MLKKVPQQDRSRAVVDSILQAATRILSEHPTHEFTTNRVAAFAGVGIGSLYQYFESKQSIAAALQQRHAAEGSDLAEKVFLSCEGQPITRRYRTLVREMFAFHERELSFHCRIAPFVQGYVVAIDTAPRKRHLQMVAALLREEFYELDTTTSLLHAQVLFQTAHALVHWAVNLKEQRDTALQLHYDCFVRGLKAAIRGSATA